MNDLHIRYYPSLALDAGAHPFTCKLMGIGETCILFEDYYSLHI